MPPPATMAAIRLVLEIPGRFGGATDGGAGSGSGSSSPGARKCGTWCASEDVAGGGAATGGGGATTGAGISEAGGGKIAGATGGSSVAPKAGAAGGTTPAGMGTGALDFSLNLAAASGAGVAIGGGATGDSPRDLSTGGIVPIGGNESGGGSTDAAATAAEGTSGITGAGSASAAWVGCGFTARRGFKRTFGSAEAIPLGCSPDAAVGGVVGAVGRGGGAERGGLPLAAPGPLPVVSGAGAMGAAAGPVGAGSLPARKRGFKRRAGGWDSSLIP